MLCYSISNYLMVREASEDAKRIASGSSKREVELSAMQHGGGNSTTNNPLVVSEAGNGDSNLPTTMKMNTDTGGGVIPELVIFVRTRFDSLQMSGRIDFVNRLLYPIVLTFFLIGMASSRGPDA